MLDFCVGEVCGSAGHTACKLALPLLVIPTQTLLNKGFDVADLCGTATVLGTYVVR